MNLNNTRSDNMSTTRQGQQIVHTYDLPYQVRKSLCDLLDADGSWVELAGRVGFDDTQTRLFSHALYRRESPTGDLLTKWEQRCPRVTDLFNQLFVMKHIRSMMILMPFVDSQYHALVDEVRSELETRSNPVLNNNTNQQSKKVDIPFLRVECLSESSKHSLSQLGAVGGLPSSSNVHDYVNERKVINQNVSVQWNDLSNPDDQSREARDTNVQTQTSDGLSDIERTSPDVDMEVNYKELVIATDDFCKDRIIGSGGFGVVYQGEWKGTQVAIKKLKGIDNVSQAINEFKVLNRYRIDNIVPLYGISLDGPQACLVYQFMPNGSLEDKLLGKCKKGQNPIILSWNQRAHIGEGIAKGLNYLHTLKGKPLVHGDVKSANVLLDSQLEPKLGDFGLSRVISSNLPGDKKGVYTHLTVTSVHGTSVYLPAEYLRQKILSPAVDVYSYGIVMLEMATGRRAFDGHRLLVELVQDEIAAGQSDPSREGALKLKDPKLIVNSNNLMATSTTCSYNPSSVTSAVYDDDHWFHSLITLGLDCANKLKKKRPSMNQILDFYGQCKTRDKIRRISLETGSKAIQGRTSPSGHILPPDNSIRSPLELQLWYDMMIGRERPTTTNCPTLGSSPRETDPPSFTNISDAINPSLSTFSQMTLDDGVPLENPSPVPQVTKPDELTETTSETTSTSHSINSVIPLLTELGITSSSKESQQ